jgi:LacI family transcriptional regulator
MMNGQNKTNVTVKEIARRANVSVSTVSRVLSGADTMIPISEKTRKKVLAVCEEMQFLPDINHARLQTRRSHTIGLLVQRYAPGSGNQFIFDEAIGRFLSTMEAVLSARGYGILIQGVDTEYEESRQYLKILRNNTADGIIIWEAFRDRSALLRLRDEQRPSIAVAFPYEEAANYIVPDNDQGAYDITRHLIEQGHQHIVFMNAGSHEIVDTLRERGYSRAMDEKGYRKQFVRADYTQQGGINAAEKLFNEHKNATALFAANDLMAIGALHVAQARKIRVPQDFAIAGFDGSSHSNVTSPKLTTGRLPLEEIGERAANTVCDMVEGKRSEGVQETLPIQIIKRGSTVAE